MAEQESLDVAGQFSALQHGLYKRMVDDAGRIIHTAWMRACAEQMFVGTCRNCGAYLLARPPEQVNDKRTDYEATCMRCGRVILAPCGVVFRRSAIRAERPRSGKG
jgi:hypothetical protein